MARSATGIGQLADGAFALPTLDDCGRLGESFQSLKRGPGFRIRSRRRHHLQNTCGRDLSKGGLEAAGTGRSKGGLTTKIHAAVDALGLPIRIVITPGQWGDCPQALGLIEGLSDAQHVIMDAAYDADHLRSFIADDLDATAHIKRNPTRREDRYIDWVLYKERHLVECFSIGSNASAGSPCAAKRPSAHSKPSLISHAPWRGSVKCRRHLGRFGLMLRHCL